MSRVIFYTSDLQESVDKFMESIQADQEKAKRFITFDQMSLRTKVTLESPAEVVVSSIITFASLINDIFIFVPWMSLIRGSLKETIDASNVSDVTYSMITTSESRSSITLLSGETENNILVVPDNTELQYEMFVPTVKKILYLLKTSQVEELLSTVKPNAEIKFNDVNKLRVACELDDSITIAVSIPQLQVGTWIEMSKMLENALINDPVDVIYCETDDVNDFFMQMVCKSAPNIQVKFGTRAFELVETPENAEEEIPSVEAEVVNE